MAAETISEAPPVEQPKRPIGRFIVGHATFHHDWRALLPLMSRCVILRAESLFHMDGIEYLALCDAFEPIDQGQHPPLYIPKMEYDAATGAPVVLFAREHAPAE